MKPYLSMPGLPTFVFFSALSISGHALAESSPYFIGLSQTLGYDSNIFRRDDRTQTIPNPIDPSSPFVIRPESSGLISTTSIIAGFNQQISRQRVYADGSLGYVSYGNQSQLNSPIYNITGGLEWQTADPWSGKVGLAASQRQGPYDSRRLDDLTGAVVRVSGAKLTDNSQRAEFLVRLGTASSSRVWLEGGLVYDHLDRQSDFGPFGIGAAQWIGFEEETSSTSLSLSARTRTSGALTLGAGLRTSKRDSSSSDLWANNEPPAEAVPRADDDSRRNSLDLFADWEATGASKLNARLSFGRTRYDDSSQNANSSRWSTSLAWAWQPTGKTSMTTRVSYDQEDRERGFGPGSDDQNGDYFTSLSWSGTYIATGKITLDAGVGMVWRPFDSLRTNDNGRSGQKGSDDTLTLRVGMSYQALRNVSSGCSIGYYSQSSSGNTYAAPPSGEIRTRIDNTRSAYTPSCFVQVVLQ